MQTLFSQQTIRILNMSELLFVHEKHYNHKEWAAYNHCSLQTVYDDSELMTRRWPQHFTISQTGAITSINNSFSDFMHIKRDLLYHEGSLKIILEIAFNPHLKIIDYAVRLNLSESYIRTSIKEINLKIMKYDLHICLDKNTHGYYLSAQSELMLASFISEVIKISAHEKYIKQLPEANIFWLDQVIDELKVRDNKIVNYEFCQVAKITEMRKNQGFKAVNYQDLSLYIKETIKIKPILFHALSQFCSINKLEITHYDFNKIFEILTALSLKIAMSKYRIDDYFNRYDYFYLEFSKINPCFIQSYQLTLGQLSEKLQLNFVDYRSDLFFHIYTNMRTVRKYRQFKIGIYSDMGVGHEKALVQLLNKHFGIHHLEPYQSQAHYDLILSTTSHYVDKRPHVLIISDLPNASDMKHIYEAIYYRH